MTDPYGTGGQQQQPPGGPPQGPYGQAPGGHPPAQQPWGGQPGPAYPQQPYPQAQGMTVAPKSPAVSLLLSFFIPGVGSMINGDVGKGVAILVGYIISWFLIIVIIGIFGVIGFWIWGMVDAYQGAKLWNARHGIIS